MYAIRSYYAHHLRYNDLDVFIGDVNPLSAVNHLNFRNDILEQCFFTKCCKDIMA